MIKSTNEVKVSNLVLFQKLKKEKEKGISEANWEKWSAIALSGKANSMAMKQAAKREERFTDCDSKS